MNSYQTYDIIDEFSVRLGARTPWFGMGRQVRMSHEVCLIATRGHPARLSNSIRSVIEAVVLAHSAKPALMYETIEASSPGPYCELFARHRRTGWHSFGDALT